MCWIPLPTYPWKKTPAVAYMTMLVCCKLFAFQQRNRRDDSSGGCQSSGGWMLFEECSKVTGHPALCPPSDCHTSRQRLPEWKGWASLVTTDGEFLLPALPLVMHSPCFPAPGTPLTLPSAYSAHYSGWVTHLKKKKKEVNSFGSELHWLPEGSGLAHGGGE